MNENMSIITEARKLVKQASSQLCDSYNDLCGSSPASEILSVLDGELRMAVQLQTLEKFYTNDVENPVANEYELKKFVNNEKS